MQTLSIAVFIGIVALATTTSYAPGTKVTTVTTSVTTVTSDEESNGILSSHERGIIRKTWDQVKRDGDVAPQVLFRFIVAHPEYQKKFSKFADVPQSELLANGNFLAQAYTILAGLNVVVQSLSSQELLANQLNALGGAHQPRAVTAVMFEEFGVIVEQVVEEKLGSTYNAEAKAAWRNGIRALVGGVSKTLKNPEDLIDPLTKLSPHQIRDVQRSWENIRSDRNALVSSIFIKLFKETPRIHKHFAKFSAVAVDALSGNDDYTQQVALVADRLDTMISAMDDKLQLLGNINYMKYSHIKRGVSRQSFEDFSRLLMDVLGAKGVSSDDLESWKGVLTVFVNGVSPKN